MQGIIRHYSHERGFGFIADGPAGGLYFHISAVAGSDGDELDPGVHVSFVRSHGFDGRPRAVEIMITDVTKDAPPARQHRRDDLVSTGGYGA